MAGSLITAAAVLALPVPAANAAGPSPSFSVPSVSYSGQPRPFSVRIENRLDGGNLVASLSNAGNSGSMRCAPDGAVNGKGTWLCTARSSRPLALGSVRVTAQGVDPSNPSRNSAKVTRPGTVSSRFSVAGGGSVPAGGTFTVSGTRDHVSGLDDFGVTARVTRNGATVLGQSGVGCAASGSGSGYRCTLRTGPDDGGSSYAVTVTETSALGGGSRSGTATVAVTGSTVVAAPRVTGPSTVAARKQPFTVTGTAGAPGLRIQVLVDSTNWSNPAATCTSGSSLGWSCTVPGSYPAGRHTISARAVDPANPSRISSVTVHTAVVQKPPAEPKPTPTATPTPTPAAPTPTEAPPVAEKPVAHVEQLDPVGAFTSLSGGADNLVALLLLGLGLVAVARPLSLARTGSTSAAFTDRDALDPQTVAHRHEGIGPGDQSSSWRLLGHEVMDELSRLLPVRLARRSPFLARLALDGTEFRAVLGGLWWLLPLGGIALGVVGAGQAGGDALPPSLGVLVGVTVLAAFDATAGFLAAVAFGVALVLAASGDRTHALLVALGVGVLWTALPLAASALRPFRRPRPRAGRWWHYTWDRSADVLLAGLVCGWLAELLAEVMSQLAGRPTGIPAHAGIVGLAAGSAIAARVLFSHAAELWWPERLLQTEAFDDLPEPSALSVATGMVLRGLAFAFAGHVFLGTCWQWVLGSLLFVLPDVVAVLDARYGGRLRLRIPVPRGVSAILLVVVLGILLVMLAVGLADSEAGALRWVYLFAGLVSAGVGLVQTFDDSPRNPGSSWPLQLGGVAVAGALAVLAIHGLNF